MTEQPVGPRCGNNPNVQLTDGDRKAVNDFKARLALQASARPYIDNAVWVDGDPLMEIIAVTVWERCARDDENTPQLVCDDPRTIAAFAAAVARAHAAAPSAPADRAAVLRAETAEDLRSDLYDDLDSFQRQTGISGLQHAQIRDHLATYLVEGLLRRAADEAQVVADDPCPGFPDRCPNPVLVNPDPPAHFGGVRCGCGKHQPAAGAQQPETQAALKRAHVALAAQAGRDQAAVARVRAYLASQTDALPESYPVAVPAAEVLAALDGQASTEQPAAASQPDDGPAAPLRRSADDCPGFPERCPNLRPVDPNPPVHLGGIRCGCADKEATQ